MKPVWNVVPLPFATCEDTSREPCSGTGEKEVRMSAGTAPSGSGNRWKELYNAALFESDKNKLSERIANAEWALALRARECVRTVNVSKNGKP